MLLFTVKKTVLYQRSDPVDFLFTQLINKKEDVIWWEDTAADDSY